MSFREEHVESICESLDGIHSELIKIRKLAAIEVLKSDLRIPENLRKIVRDMTQ